MSNMDLVSSDQQTRVSEGSAMIRRICAVAMLGMALLLASNAGAQEAVAASAPAETSKKLDLRIPEITELYTEEQIQAFLAPTYHEYTEEVEVRGKRETVTPNVWPGIAAPIWGILNPTQAWRIFAPLPPDQTRALAFSADVTTPYQEPTARTATDW
jgi:hypothetical protein